MTRNVNLSTELKSFADYMRNSGYSDSTIRSYRASVKKSSALLGISIFNYAVTLRVNNLSFTNQQIADKVWGLMVNNLEFSNLKSQHDFRTHIRLATRYIFSAN